MNWQPIETAPKDGTKIDLWDAAYGCRVVNAKWDNHYSTGDKSWGRNSVDGPFCYEPTHWMPIPQPPEP